MNTTNNSTTLEHIKGAGGTALAIMGVFVANADQIEQWVRILCGLAAMVAGVATAWNQYMSIRWKRRALREGKPYDGGTSILKAAAMLLVVAGIGCGQLIPMERQQSASVKATEALATQQAIVIRRALESGPEQGMRVARDGTVISVPLKENLEITSTTSQDAGTRSSASGMFSQTMPLWVKILGMAIAIAVFVGVVRWVITWAKTTSWGQFIELGDGYFKRRIQKYRERIAESQDAAEKARYQSEIAELEAERGQLKTKRP